MSMIPECRASLTISIVPSEDEHQSENLADSDKRREWISKCVDIRAKLIVALLGPLE